MNAPDIATVTDPAHFTRAITDLGDKCTVVTTQAIFNDRGIKIIEKGVTVNASLYDRLMAHRLPTPLEQSVSTTPTVTGAVLRDHAEQAMAEVPFFQRMAAEAQTRSLLLDALETLALPDPIAFQLSLAKEVRPALFRHSIHAALLAAWLRLDALVSRFDMGLAAAAGLLHDVGMLHLDPVLLQPHGAIAREQRRQLYSHPLVSTALIERHHEYPRELLRAVREHHEFLDGSGYPRHLSGPAIGPLARILCLGELVTSMLALGGGLSEMRLWVKLRMNAHRYDPTLVARVQRHLQLGCEQQTNTPILLTDPVACLQEINLVVADWPRGILQRRDLSDSRRQGMLAVAGQADQLYRTLAGVGVAPQQLAQLGSEALEEALQLELTLLAQEAQWQLRTLARQTRRRWRLGAEPDYPDALRAWLDRVDTLVADA
ncbi:HD domain-containing phosphohydrolase [Rhodoferax sp.]|uniref:HD-GYP domain-containing protein n=1 Tax=Rhodoferax sp. TaxID=50421 RepID=UPI002627D731|nr:HD domain-containing phosphohydrolase [Rhodoferax sp.]MDD2920519.1 HD domain-containing protein [Rhodoferax sp.]